MNFIERRLSQSTFKVSFFVDELAHEKQSDPKKLELGVKDWQGVEFSVVLNLMNRFLKKNYHLFWNVQFNIN